MATCWISIDAGLKWGKSCSLCASYTAESHLYFTGEEIPHSEDEKEKKTPGDEPNEEVSTKYRLRGLVVHSGQASGGHYYSFIQLKWVSPRSPL